MQYINHQDVDLDDPVISLQCLALADYLNASKFKQYIESVIISLLNLDFVTSAYCYATKFGACRLLDKSEQMIRSSFGQLESSELEWLEQSDMEYFIETNEEHAEIDLLRTLLKWIEHYPSHANILSFIRPALLTSTDLETLCIPEPAEAQFNLIRERVITCHKNIYTQPLMVQDSIRSAKAVYCQVDGVQVKDALKIPHRIANRPIKSAMSELNMTKEHKNYRDPSHSVVQVNGFIFCLGGVRKFGLGASSKVIR